MTKHAPTQNLTQQIFPYGSPVTGHDLVGREAVIKTLANDLRGGQHILLPGPRRTGKSSVLLESLACLARQGYLTAYVDIAAVNTPRELAMRLVSSVLASNNSRLQKLLQSVSTKLKDLFQFKEFKAAYEQFEVVATLKEPSVDENQVLDQAFDFLDEFPKKKKKSLIVAFDEFGEIATIDATIIKKMRAKFQLHKHCSYLFSGSQESVLKEIFSDPNEPFFGFTKLVTLPPIDSKSFAKYIQSQFLKASIRVHINQALLICQITRTHPFYAKVFANAVYEQACLSGHKILDDAILREGYKRAFTTLRPQMEGLWLELGSRSRFLRQVCQSLALQNINVFSQNGLRQIAESAHIAQALRQLETKGIIQKMGSGSYQFSNCFLRDFILSLADVDYFEQGLSLAAPQVATLSQKVKPSFKVS